MRVAVIGSGPGGYLAAARLAASGAEVDLYEKGEIGGVCLNYGCVPTKHLLAYAKAYQKAFAFGLDVKGANVEDAVAHARKGAAFFRENVTRFLRSNSVNIIRAEAKLYPEKRVEANGESRIYDAVVVAVGSKPIIPEPLKGLPILTGEDYEFFQGAKRIAVVGAGAQGIEIASFYRLLGAEVFLVEILPRLLPSLPEKVAALYEGRLKRRGIIVYKGKKIAGAEFEHGYFTLSFEKGEKLEGLDKVIVAAGRAPATETIHVNQIKDEKGYVIVNQYLETPEKGVYAIGDCIKTPALAYVAYAEAEVCAANILGAQMTLDYNHLPYAIFGWPEIAWIGKLEGSEIRIQAGVSGKALAEHEDDGFVILYQGKEGLNGGVIVGLEAAEIIHLVEAFILKGNFESFYFVHPTLSEVFGEAVFSLLGRKRHG
jgi:dihydrolipoamide dehydrogenase